jgi:hypothetical protein
VSARREFHVDASAEHAMIARLHLRVADQEQTNG